MATSSVKKNYNQNYYYEPGWQNLHLARTEEGHFVIQLPGETMDQSKTYSCASITGSYKNVLADTATAVTTGTSTEVRFKGNIMMVFFNLPAGLTTWTYGLFFSTSAIEITESV